MRVVIEPGVLVADPGNTPQILKLLQFAIDGWHDVLVHPDAVSQWEQWLSRRDPEVREIYRDAERSSQKRQGHFYSDRQLRIVSEQVPADTVDGIEPEAMTLDSALELLPLPFELLVEDETSDGYFLDRAIPPSLRPAWATARGQHRLRLDSLGGVTQTKRRLEGERGQPPRSRRMMLVIDSDAPQPWRDHHRPPEESWDGLPNHNRSAALAARNKDIPVHVLERRMIENYLPPPTLLSWAQSLHEADLRDESTPHAEHFQRLPPERRHHHNLKTGLPPKERPYYGALSADAEQALSTGLHRRATPLWKAFELATDVDLREDGVHHELTPLFRRILGAL